MDDREKQLAAQVDLWRGKFTAFVASVWEMVNINDPYEYPDQVLNFISQDIVDYKQRIAALQAQNARLLALVREIVDKTPGTPPMMTSDLILWNAAQKARALLAKLEGGTDDHAAG